MPALVLSVAGADRPGLTEALAGAVLSADGNWLESHLSRLGGLYVGSVLVDVPDGQVEALRAAVKRVDAEGLEVRIAPAAKGSTAGGREVDFTLVGQDRPGIVRQVTAVFSRLGANIEAFDTGLTPEPHTGGALFRITARLRLPRSTAIEAVRSALEDLSAEIMVDVSLRAVEGE